MKKKIIIIIFPLLLIALITGVALTHKSKTSYSHSGTSVSNSGFYFDTTINITLYDNTDDQLIDGCFDKCAEYENLLSRTKKGSDIWKINHAKGRKTEVDERTAKLIKTALRYCKITNGRFDISIAAASSLWDFDAENPTLPDKNALSEAVKHIDYKKITVSKESGKYYVRLADPKMMIDLGAIAKGYIADELKSYLKGEGVKRAIINLGGNVLAIGSLENDKAFRIGIQYPFKNEGTIITSVALKGQSLVTSGPYERYFKKNGKIYHHILNPKTGYSVNSDMVSVTICSSSSVQADALSTCVFILGYKKGAQLIKNTKGVSALIITKDMKQHRIGNFPSEY